VKVRPSGASNLGGTGDKLRDLWMVVGWLPDVKLHMDTGTVPCLAAPLTGKPPAHVTDVDDTARELGPMLMLFRLPTPVKSASSSS